MPRRGAFEDVVEDRPKETRSELEREREPKVPSDGEVGPEPTPAEEREVRAAADATAEAEEQRRLLEWRGYFFYVRWDRGIRIEEKKKRFQLKIGGRILVDATRISGDPTIDSLSETGWVGGARQVRLDFTGTVGKRVYYRMQVDVTGESETDFSPSAYLKDFFVGITGLGPLGRLEAGILKEPISMGVLTSGLNLDFLERGLPTIMAPSFNTGLTFRNEILDDKVSWTLGIFRGQNDSDNSSAVDIVGRLAGLAWKDEEKGRFLHLGAAYKLEVGDFEQRYRARPETNWGDHWIDTGDIAADHSHLVGLEVAGLWDSISFQAEWLSSWIGQPGGPTLHFWGLYGQVSYFLTGEQRYYRERLGVFGRVRLNDNFSLRDRTCGALELTARYSYLDLDDRAVLGGRLSDLTFGLNWYLQSNLRVMFNYTWARLNGMNNGSIVGTRFQIDY